MTTVSNWGRWGPEDETTAVATTSPWRYFGRCSRGLVCPSALATSFSQPGLLTSTKVEVGPILIRYSPSFPPTPGRFPSDHREPALRLEEPVRRGQPRRA